MKQRVLKYYSGETVWTLNGIDWFITDLNDETIPIAKPNINRVALDMTAV